MIRTIEVTDGGIRIDKWLAEQLPDLSRSYIAGLISDNLLTVNGKKVKASYKVDDEDIIELDIPESIEPDIPAQDIPLDIVYEDEDVILINKPKNTVVHPAPGHYTDTVVNALLYHCGDSLSGINGIKRPGIVHRIDKDTTGIIIACKNDMAHTAISAQLKEHSITRAYRAIVHGVIRDDEGTVTGNIARSTNDRKKMAVVTSGGREAITHYKVLKRFREYTYIECRLETGRTHQIRVHMDHIGHPLLGDQTYGVRKSPYKTEGQVLHAMTLGFIHPRSGEYMEFSAPLPEYFSHLLEVIPE